VTNGEETRRRPISNSIPHLEWAKAIDESDILISRESYSRFRPADWNESRRWLASGCEEEKSRWKMRTTPNGEAAIPFVPFQSEIAYNVEIKRSPPLSGRGTSGASEVAVRRYSPAQ